MHSTDQPPDAHMDAALFSLLLKSRDIQRIPMVAEETNVSTNASHLHQCIHQWLDVSNAAGAFYQVCNVFTCQKTCQFYFISYCICCLID